ncbi:hypothetical protein A2572_03210 [Candidatus Collierbacteria bacterium RIFOXYD1_FULL_40_9]|uniref:Uncharacterized protein n=1 Tax=Candidatus Collierbacteria bacterium RIFOXYD1_FULL_40_9 TaxID=1817731 RepID=A0A1F5FWW3_9BACT|nr:MAG: hypothetical protein A2572_03210 [Candidatus Collierbacteria bacterium RIFOXYD1_FULL_40_9]
MSEKRPFPNIISFWKLLGPSFLVLAMGLGSGEVILWPYLVSQYGLGIAWGALLGISMQFFVNMEIERYALIKGESVFVGLFKKVKWSGGWFIFSTFVGFGLPGIVAASAKMVGHVFGVDQYKYLAICFLIFMGLVLTLNQSVYRTMETITKLMIVICVPLILLLVVIVVDGETWKALFGGLVGKGEGFRFLPHGISVATFLAAFAYSGAGGNLNLTQSIYIKEKGYGMGKYSQKLSGLLRKNEEVSIQMTGVDFEDNVESRLNFRKWWNMINMEHLIVFWGMGLLSMFLLMLLSYSTTFGKTSSEGISFVIDQANSISLLYGGLVGAAVLFVLGLLLFQTQMGILDSTSRIMGENLALIRGAGDGRKMNLSRIYFMFVWLQVVFGVVLFLMDYKEPRFLIVLGAVINAFAMLVHVILVRYLNQITFKGVFATSLWRKIILLVVIAFFAFFSVYNIYTSVF